MLKKSFTESIIKIPAFGIGTVIFFILIFLGNANSQKVLSLDEAIKIALNSNSNIMKSGNSILGYESNVQASFGSFLPNISAGASWNWSRTEDKGGTINVGNAIIQTPNKTSESRTYGASLNTNWRLFDGLSNYNTLNKSRKDFESAELSLQRLKQDIVFQTISGFYNLINLEKLIQVKEDNLKWNQKNFEIIQEKNRVGAGILADVYSQQVKVGNAELELIQAKNDYENEKANFLFFLGIDVTEPYHISDSSIKVDEKLDDKYVSNLEKNFTNLIEEAFSYRPDYNSAIKKVEASIYNLSASKGNYLPSLTNTASFSLRGQNPSDVFDNKSYFIGLNLNIPIFQGWSISNRVQFAEIELKNSKISLSDVEREIKKNLQKNYLDLVSAGKRLEVSNKNVLAARENLQIEEEKYKLGSTTLLNVLIANAEYTNAKTIYVNSQYNFLRLKEQINYNIGKINLSKYE